MDAPSRANPGDIYVGETTTEILRATQFRCRTAYSVVAVGGTSGGLLAAALPQVGWWPGAFLFLVPLLALIRAGASPIAAAAAGGLAACISGYVGLGWTFSAVRGVAGASPAGAASVLGVVLCIEVLRGASCALLITWWRDHGRSDGLAATLSFPVVESIAPLPAPWSLGVTLIDVSPLAQVADLAGAASITAVLVSANVGIERALRYIWVHRTHRHRSVIYGAFRVAGPWLAGVGAASLYGGWRLGTMEQPDQSGSSVDSVLVGVIQPNVGPLETAATHDGIRAVRKQVLLTRRAVAAGTQLVVWPETAVSVAVPMSMLEDLYPRLFTAGLGVRAIIGAALARDEEGRSLVNAAVDLDRDGAVRGVYVKSILAPVGEYLPAGWSAVRSAFPMLRGLSKGTDQESRALPVGQNKVSVFICYESLFAQHVRAASVEAGSAMLVHLSNDAWLPSDADRRAHLAVARLRAIENRRYLARAATNGISAIVDPSGRVIATAPAQTEAFVVGRAAWRTERTAFQITGNLSWYLCAAVLVVGCIPRRRR